jgi:hypothetical protein
MKIAHLLCYNHFVKLKENFSVTFVRLFLFVFFLFLLTAYNLQLTALPSFAAYPNLQIDGYKEWNLTWANINPSSNLLQAQSYLSGVRPTPFDWREKMQLKIMGSISERLSVSYDLEQQPEMPEKYDIVIQYDNHKLTFGDFTGEISGNDFASINKSMRGVKLESQEKDREFKIISSKDRSFTKTDTFSGSKGKGPYKLSHTFIIDGSQEVRVNRVLMREGNDYIFDSFEGQITFTQMLIDSDEIEVKYEYSDQIDFFFPTASQKNFLGMRGRKDFGTLETQDQVVREEVPIVKDAEETFKGEEILKLEDRKIKLANYPVVIGSQKVFLNNEELKTTTDYTFDFGRGELNLIGLNGLPLEIKETDLITVRCQYYETKETAEEIRGQDSRGPYRLKNKNIALDSEEITIDGEKRNRDLDYQLDKENGEISFKIEVSRSQTIKIKYRFLAFEIKEKVVSQGQKPFFSLGTTYLRESGAAGSQSLRTATSQTITITSTDGTITKKYSLSSWPLVESLETITAGSVTLKKDTNNSSAEWDGDYIIDHDKGEITFADSLFTTGPVNGGSALISGSTVSVSYTYKKAYADIYYLNGNQSTDAYYLKYRPVKYYSEIVTVRNAGESVETTLIRYDSSKGKDAYPLYLYAYTINYQEGTLDFLYRQNDTYDFQTWQVPRDTTITVSYNYIPQDSTEDSSLVHDVLGVDANFKIGSIVNLKGTFARSQINQASAPTAEKETFRIGTGAGETAPGTLTFTLTQKPLKDSDFKVKLNNNLLTDNNDYIVYYDTGKITLKQTLSPASGDVLTVEYNYSSLIQTAGRNGDAFEIKADNKIGVTSFGAAFREIDPKFLSIGSIQGVKGNKINQIYLKRESEDFSYGLERLQTQTQISSITDTPYYSNIIDQKYSLGFKPLKLGKLTASIIKTESVDDLLPTKTTRDNDFFKEEQKLGFSFGPSWFDTLIERSATVTESDIIDLINRSTAKNSLWRIKNNWLLTKVITITSDIQDSQTQNETSSANTLKSVSAQDLSLKYFPAAGFSSTVQYFRQGTDEHDASKKPTTYERTAYIINTKPTESFSLNTDLRHEQETSPLIGKEGTKKDNINFDTSWKPYSSTNIYFKTSQSSSSEDSTRRSFYLTKTFSLNFIPYNFLAWDNSYNKKISDSFTETSSSSIINRDINSNLNLSWAINQHFIFKPGLGAISSFLRDSTDQGGGFTFLRKIYFDAPIAAALSFNGGLSFEDYSFISDLTSTKTATANYVQDFNFNLNPSSFNLSVKYNRKTVNKDSIEYPLQIITVNFSRPLTTTTKLVFDYEGIDTNGKLIGGRIESYNVFKETMNLGIDMEFPISTVPETLIVGIKGRQVHLEDRAATANSFLASSLVLQVKLGF